MEKVQHSFQEDKGASVPSRQNCKPVSKPLKGRTCCVWVQLGHQHYESIVTAPTEKENWCKRENLGGWLSVCIVYAGGSHSRTHSPDQGRDLKFIFVLLQPMENIKLNLLYTVIGTMK